VPILAAAVLLGPSGGLLVGGASQVVRGIHRRSRWNRVVFNVSTQALAGAAAGAVYAGLARLADTSNVFVLSLPVVAAGLVYFLHTLLVAVGVGTELRMSPLRVWNENSRWLWSHYAVLSVMGLLLAVAYREHGMLGAAAFAVPPLMMRFAAKQYVDHTVQNVRQLRSLNEQLSDEVARRTAMEQEVARLAQEAADAEAALKLGQLKSEFVTIASHELRTPVTSILGFAELLVELTSAADPRREMLAQVFDESRRLADLLNDLLDVSRLEAGRVTVDAAAVDLDRLVGEVIATAACGTTAHRLSVDLAPKARWVRADTGKLKQILTNLVDNAVKYSPDGGDVRVSARPDGAGGVVVAVADDGIGIPPELQGRIFDRFHRVDATETRTVRGTGLGLYIVKQLADLHGASVAVDSEPGRGSTFSIALPAADAPSPEAAAEPAGADVPVPSAMLQPAVA
jgi:signal transduction histidine kinase